MKSKQAPEASNMMTHDHHVMTQDDHHSPLAGELMDLYVAMLIVIPIAFVLKSIWF